MILKSERDEELGPLYCVSTDCIAILLALLHSKGIVHLENREMRKEV